MEFKTTLSKFNVNDQNFLDVSLESEKILQSSCQDRSLAIVIIMLSIILYTIDCHYYLTISVGRWIDISNERVEEKFKWSISHLAKLKKSNLLNCSFILSTNIYIACLIWQAIWKMKTLKSEYPALCSDFLFIIY